MKFMHGKIELDNEKVYTSNRGERYVIISGAPPKESVQAYGNIRNITRVIIKFIDTGTEKMVFYDNAKKGSVRDPFSRSVYGIGYMGNATSEGNLKAFGTWKKMLSRCYNPNNPSYKIYGGAGVTVCDRWHCFEYFLEDLKQMDNYEEWYNCNDGSYNIDKDILQADIPKNQMVYSKDTCLLVNKMDNVYHEVYSRDKSNDSSQYIGISKKGENYNARISINGIRYDIGSYDDEIVAASVYNFIIKMNNMNSILYNEGIPEFNYEIAQSHYVSPKFLVLPIPNSNIILRPNINTGYCEVENRGYNYITRIKRKSYGSYTTAEAAATVANHVNIINHKSPNNYVSMTLGQAVNQRTYKGRDPVDMCVYRRDLAVNSNQYYTPHDPYCDQFGNVMQPTDPGQVAPAVSSQMNQPIQPAAFTYGYQPIYGYGYNYPQNQPNRPMVEMCRIVK